MLKIIFFKLMKNPIPMALTISTKPFFTSLSFQTTNKCEKCQFLGNDAIRSHDLLPPSLIDHEPVSQITGMMIVCDQWGQVGQFLGTIFLSKVVQIIGNFLPLFKYNFQSTNSCCYFLCYFKTRLGYF